MYQHHSSQLRGAFNQVDSGCCRWGTSCEVSGFLVNREEKKGFSRNLKGRVVVAFSQEN